MRLARRSGPFFFSRAPFSDSAHARRSRSPETRDEVVAPPKGATSMGKFYALLVFFFLGGFMCMPKPAWGLALLFIGGGLMVTGVMAQVRGGEGSNAACVGFVALLAGICLPDEQDLAVWQQ